MKRIIGVLLLATACTVSQPSETKVDSVATLSTDTLEMATDEVAAADTIFQPVVLDKKVATPFLEKNTRYVFNKEGLEVTDAAGELIGHIEYKAKVTIKPEVKSDLAAIEFKGGTAFVTPQYLLPIPVPETKDVTEYFLATLKLSKDPVERKNTESYNDSDAMFSFIDYYFEGGFKVITGSQYESGFTTVKLPGLNAEQAFLFASYFYESFDESFTEFPTAPREEDLPQEKHITVTAEGNKITGILVGNGEGCYWEDSISVTDDGAMMNSSGGC